ncbi:MAG: hypothetical protein A4E28_02527 [Methanocella sp. PtaU1.Bin125]|nr:MAG: hypothetical protein A4E28_02527 [Methanocella sp. PtaU1.Bin125]
MKWNTIIIIALGLVVVAAAALALLNLGSNQQAAPGNNTARASPTPVPPPVKSDVLEMFDVLKDKINASGHTYAGAAVQVIEGDETAMVYMYKPVSQADISGPLAAGFGAVYSAFEHKDPLLVGLVDTTQKISAQQYKVDIYALERPVVAAYLAGTMTAGELANKALYVTPETASLRTGNNTTVKKAVDMGYNRSGNYTPPSNRTMMFSDALERGGYAQPLSMQAGPMSDGQRAVNVVMPLRSGATNEETYSEIESVLKACAESYGDYDRFMISLLPEQETITDYYYVDAAAPPVLAFANGDISQYQLYNALNLTYYTK